MYLGHSCFFHHSHSSFACLLWNTPAGLVTDSFFIFSRPEESVAACRVFVACTRYELPYAPPGLSWTLNSSALKTQ